MKNKCVCALIFCTILTSSILTSCGNPAASEISRMVNSGSLLAIDAESDLDQILEGDPAPWEPLAENTACSSLRTAIDRCLGIEVSGDYKNGVLYVNPADESWNANNTLENAYKNKAFVDQINDKDTTNALKDAVRIAYRDLVDVSDDNIVRMAALNAYYNLFPADDTTSQFEGDKYLTRAQFMSGLAKAHIPAPDDLKASEKTIKQLGDNEYTPYAELVTDYAYLDITSDSLNKETFMEPITRAEAAYLLAKTYYADEFAKISAESTCYTDVKNAGDLSEQAETTGKKQFHSANLIYMLDHTENGLDEELYDALVIAYQHSFFDTSKASRWNEPITKQEALETLLHIYGDLGTTIQCANGTLSEEDAKKANMVILGGKEYDASEIENAGTAELADVYGKLPPLTFEEWVEATSSIPSSKKEMYFNHVHANFGPNVSEGVKKLSPEQYVWFIKMDVAMDYGITDKEEIKKDWILTEGEVDESLQDLYYGGSLSDVEKIAYEQIYGITKPEVTYTKKKDTSTDNSSSQSSTASVDNQNSESSTDNAQDQPQQEAPADISDDVSADDSTGGDYGFGEYETGNGYYENTGESTQRTDRFFMIFEGM